WLFRLAVIVGVLVANPFLRTQPPKGLLALNTPPESTARITDGKEEWIVRTPKARLELPPGDYRAYIAGKTGKRGTVAFRIRETLRTAFAENLRVLVQVDAAPHIVGPRKPRPGPDGGRVSQAE